MSPVPKELVDQIKSDIRALLGKNASELFVRRIDVMLEDWSTGKVTAAKACEKIQKNVSLFIDEDKAREIGAYFAPIVMRESV